MELNKSWTYNIQLYFNFYSTQIQLSFNQNSTFIQLNSTFIQLNSTFIQLYFNFYSTRIQLLFNSNLAHYIAIFLIFAPIFYIIAYETRFTIIVYAA